MTGRELRRLRSASRARERAELLGLGRLGLFVPALMSVGLVFWIVSEITEVARSSAEAARARRAERAAAAVSDDVLGRHSPVAPGLRDRAVYLVAAVVLLGIAAYVVTGSAGNYLRRGGYVVDVGWLLALAVAAGVVAAAYGLTSLTVFLTWPDPPPWARGVLLRSPLGSPVADDEVGHRPPWYLTASVGATTAALAALAALVAWSPEIVRSFNDTVGGWFDTHDPTGPYELLDGMGPWLIAVAVAVVAVAGLRCRVLLVGTLAAVVAVYATGRALRPLVAEAATQSTTAEVLPRTFPAIAAALVVVVGGAVVLALATLVRRPWVAWPLRVAGAVLVAGSAAHHLAQGELATDVLGGLLLGLAALLAVHWALAVERWHRSCNACRWVPGAPETPLLGAISLHPTARGAIRLAARLSAAVATVGLAALTFTIDLPEGTAGYSLDASIQQTVQLVLTLLMSVGVVLAWRWEGAGALVMALAAAGVGIFASLEYQPGVAVALTVVLMVPAVLTWLSWQHMRRPARIVALAVVTSLLIGSTWVGATTVHDHFFGPTHPESTAAAVPVDRVEWLWSGALGPDTATVVARVVPDVDAAELRVELQAGGPVTTVAGSAPDEDRMVRFEARGLQPGTPYRYVVVVDGAADGGRGSGTFTTPVEGPMSFTVTAGACAITGSNGSVYDAIAAEDPLLHLILGDLHYSNISSTDPTAFVDAYGEALTTPAQSALVRQVPVAYVWDDHDYGPNDADASSPSRTAVRDAYRRATPHYEVAPGDAPIQQAFTVGRVRFVLTDARSEHTADTMLGEAQVEWLLDELRGASRTHAVVVWVNSLPWVAPAAEGADGWAGQAEERARISQAIADAGIDNLVMVAGDAHMVAIDDGTNTDYSATGGAGFPLLHVAALDRPGSVKGGPYSEGAFPGGGQYGVLEFSDDGQQVTVRLSGRTWDGETLVAWETTMGPSPGPVAP